MKGKIIVLFLSFQHIAKGLGGHRLCFSSPLPYLLFLSPLIVFSLTTENPDSQVWKKIEAYTIYFQTINDY